MRSDRVLAKKQQTIRPFDAIKYGICANCPAGCGVKAFMNGTTPVDFFGDEEHPLNKGSLCPKGFVLYVAHDHKERVLVPGIREDTCTAWKQASWDEAVATVADKLNELDEGVVLALPASTKAPMDYVAGAEWLASVQSKAIAPAAFVPAALSVNGAIAKMFGLPASELCMGSQRDWAASRVILVVGADMAAETPVTFGPLEDARDRGSQVLYVGASAGMTAMRCNEALLVLPGTEAVIVAAIVNVILRAGKENKEFLKEFTEGIEVFRSAIATTTPESAAKVCGVTAEEIENFATLLTKKFPISVKPAASLDDDALAMCGALVAILGSIGVSGGGLNMPAVSPFRAGTGEAVSLEQLLLDGKCQAVIGFGDWASRLSGGERVRKALKACKLVVHIGSFNDATRSIAHVSLPAAHWSEYATLRDVSDSRTLQWSDALLPSAGKSRTPLDIFTAIVAVVAPEAKAPWAEAAGEDDQQRMASWLLASNPLTAGISLADLAVAEHKSAGGVQWPCAFAEDVKLEISRFLRANIRGANVLFKRFSKWPGTSFRFPTENGLIQLSSVSAPKLPVSVGKEEMFLVLSGQVLHSADQPAVVLPVASINPQTAATLKLKTDDKIVINSAEASVNASVRTSWSARPGTINMEPEYATVLLPVGATTVAIKVNKA